MNTLEATDLRAGYSDTDILNGVSIHVNAGELVCMVGPNGSGKSTLLKAIVGLLPVRSGTVQLLGEDVTECSPQELVALGVSYVPQTENVFPTLTVRENLEVAARLPRPEFERRLARAEALFPLITATNQMADTLSGGERQMLAIARALMFEPKVLLLDEPTAGLSPAMMASLLEKIEAIVASGTAVILVEQNIRLALPRSHRAYVLATGANRFEGDGPSVLESEELRDVYLGRDGGGATEEAKPRHP